MALVLRSVIFINAIEDKIERVTITFDASPQPMLSCHQAGDSSDDLRRHTSWRFIRLLQPRHGQNQSP